MRTPSVLSIPRLEIHPPATGSPGQRVLLGVLATADAAIEHLRSHARALGVPRLAAVGRLRGSGRGVHFRDLIATLEAEFPITLVSPFENSHRVAGAAWETSRLLGSHSDETHASALAKLRWAANADDLPMHVHEHADRFIIVHEGRGYFHVSDQSLEEFDGSNVRTIPARERDVFLFTRGVTHTFSTTDHAMTLLSCQLPFMPFNDPRQYTLPNHVWTARSNPDSTEPKVGCDPAWTVLAGNCGC